MRDRWAAIRNKALASPRFQRWALRFAPTRPIARAHARELFDLVAGFTYSQTLFACVELDIFSKVTGQPRRIGELAAEVDLPAASISILVDAAASLRLLERLSGDRVTLGPAGAALVGNPGVTTMIAHHRHLYADLADPVALLRSRGGGELASFWAYSRGDDPVAVAAYTDLMAHSHDAVARELLGAFRLRGRQRLLDVGGGSGRFLAEVRARAPGMALGLFDLPGVVARADVARRISATLHPGDFRLDPLPSGYDCITLVRVLHDHDDAVVAALLRSIHAALPTGGVIVIAEPMSGASGANRVGPAYFGWYLIAMGSGRPRSAQVLSTMLRKAGFTKVKERPTQLPLSAGVIVGTKA